MIRAVKMLLTGSALMSLTAVPFAGAQKLFPAAHATMVNPNVQLELTFGDPSNCRRYDVYVRQAGDSGLDRSGAPEENLQR